MHKILLLAVALMIFPACDRKHMLSNTVELKKVDVLKVVSGVGKIHGLTEATISADLAGQITSLPVKEGQSVNKGETLALLSDKEIEAKLEEAKAELDERQSNFKRQESLFKSKAITRKDFEDNQFALRKAVSAHQQMLARSNKLSISAPFSGVLLRKFKEVGETLALHEKIFMLADLSTLKFSIEVDETDIGYVKLGQKVNIAIDALPGQSFEGSVSKVGLLVEKKRTSMDDASEIMDAKIVYVDVDVAPDPRLRVGLTGIGYIQVANNPGVMALPRRAVQLGGTEASVHVVEDGRFVRRTVKIGVSDDRYLEITGGLSGGEKVLLSE
jgi:HlyD family secretion protein